MYIGQEITLIEGEQKSPKEVKYIIEAIFPGHVLCKKQLEDGTVLKRCVCFGDLVTMGLVKQNPSIEALRR